jgi:hypothetical protein
MRASTLEIIWHAKEPVLSVDFHPTDARLFATGGGDKDVKVREREREFARETRASPPPRRRRCKRKRTIGAPILPSLILLLPNIATSTHSSGASRSSPRRRPQRR